MIHTSSMYHHDELICGLYTFYLLAYISHRRAQHSTTIVSMQDTCSDEDLRQFSLQSSKRTRRRAHKLAVTYAAGG